MGNRLGDEPGRGLEVPKLTDVEPGLSLEQQDTILGCTRRQGARTNADTGPAVVMFSP